MMGWRTTLGALALVATLASARPAQAEFLDDAGWGLLTVVTNVFYMPAKVVYATVGGLTGGLAFALTGGDMETAENIWVPSMGGTYVLTANMLQGRDPIYFTGPMTTASSTSDPNGVREQPLGS
ncbi:MAG TPA: hypothetical protein VFD84_21135 [Candidatus Binatia bacterium]|nr:hypothetical protein [Candidatus Binatia bacterium]